MEAIFIKFLNMSITASFIAIAVIMLRLLLKKSPKWAMGVLWGFVAIRLVFPFSLVSVFSLIPFTEPISQNSFTAENPIISNILPSLVQGASPNVSETTPSNTLVSTSLNITLIASVIWLIGILCMLSYALISFIRINKRVKEAAFLKDNIWICDSVSTPFILGLFRPRIFLPSAMNEIDMHYVISHEKAHLKRKDYLWKPLGFLLLSIYWFNPVLWISYILLCNDIELACDEKVIKELGTEIKRPYANALINFSVPRKMISACPVAFSETGIKERVKGVLNYKKPAFWISVLAVLACVITAVCLLTNPINKETKIKGKVYLINKYYYSEVIGAERANKEQKEFRYVVDDEFYLYLNNGEGGEFVSKGKLEKRSNPQDFKPLIKKYIPSYYNLVGIKEVYTALKSEDSALRHMSCIIIMNNNDLFFADIVNFELFEEAYIYEFAKLNKGEADKEQMKKISNTVYSYIYLTETDSAFFTLIPKTGECTFTVSILSGSFYPGGTYEENNDYIIMKDSNGDETFTFKKSGEDLIFVASKSSKVPSYRYTESSEPTPSVPDGAVFKLQGAKAYIDKITADIDKDGIEETCILNYGPTSGLFTFSLSILKDGGIEYFNIFNSEPLELSFAEQNGKIKVQGVTLDENPETYLFDISIKDGDIILSNKDTKLPHWG